MSSTSQHGRPASARSSSSPALGNGVADPREHGWRSRVTLLLVGQAFSLLGSNIVQYALWWWIVLQEQSGWAMLLTTLFGVVPQGVVSIFGGSMADRYPRKRLVMLPDLIIAGVTVLLSVSFAMGWASLSVIFVVLFIRSAGGGVQTPAVQSFIPDVVPAGGLLRINAIYGMINSANMLVAPAVAAVLINVMPLWSILLIDVTTAVIGVGFVALIRVPHGGRTSAGMPTRMRDDGVETPEGGAPVSGIRRAFADLRAGLAYTMRHPRLRGVVLGDALANFVAVAPMNLTLLLMTREYEGRDLDLGFVHLVTASDKLAANELSWSVGMLLGGLVMSTIGVRMIRNAMRVGALAIGAVGLTIVGLGIAPGLLSYMVINVLCGVAWGVCAGPMRTVIQTESDEAMIGRVFGVDTTLATFGMPLGMLVFAPLADVIPISWVFVAGGLLALPVSWYVLALSREDADPHSRQTTGGTRR
ncbi:MFS transporter [Bifidobacterium sp. DSM 109958]|uniref:MFS transporter n=1 Tax=Bifidobacterium moraviense TaxID=2675323 RepID=A0A7Y0HZ99_9BIFI|nr:MFS transporter [Bifidobacterium sp. DSM 109958]NMM99994.1 MFS transporter [Bifidobacterium sp. DSM 109958]